MTALTAGDPLETPRFGVGHRSIAIADAARDGRRLGIELWYPAAEHGAPTTTYELLPGIAFRAASARTDVAVRAGRHPLVLLSHGRTGMRVSYSLVCEALAARGAVVVSADHPGDSLIDWMTGQHSDDRTNEVNRVADAHAVLHAMTRGHPAVPADIRAAVDPTRISLAGHSYGAYTAYATAAGSRGVAPHPAVRAVIGFQPYMRSMSDALLRRVSVPSLLVVSELDQTTPAEVDADRAWALLPGRPSWRLDLDGAGHHAISDIALYAELAAHVPHLPAMVRDYLVMSAAGAETAAGRTWRELMALQVQAAWAFLQVALGPDRDAGDTIAELLGRTQGIRLQRR